MIVSLTAMTPGVPPCLVSMECGIAQGDDGGSSSLMVAPLDGSTEPLHGAQRGGLRSPLEP